MTVDAAQNVIAPVNCTPGCEVVVFMAHTDTVFPDLTPMPLHREGDRLFCPGVGDDTANLAALMLAARYFRMQPQTADCGFLFVANSCEEGLGNLKGCRQLMQDYAGRVREVVSFDGGLGGICNKAVGSARYRVTVRTEGGHSFGAFGNRNAIHLLASMIDTLYAVKPPAEGDSKTTYNVGMIEGGTSVNTIAQEASMLFEYRSDSRACLEKMKAMFESIVAAYRSMGIEVEVVLLGERPCMGDVDPPVSRLWRSASPLRPGQRQSSRRPSIPVPRIVTFLSRLASRRSAPAFTAGRARIRGKSTLNSPACPQASA